MSLLKRFGYYAIGLFFGIVVVYFFLDKKDLTFDYFPNSRVLKEIRTKKKTFSPDAKHFFDENDIDTLVVSKILKQGKVHFKESQTDRDEPCRSYKITGKHKKRTLKLQADICKENEKEAIISVAGFAD